MKSVMLAAVLETGRLERLYTALSLLVSAAAEGTPARGLAGFGALPVLLLGAEELAVRAREAPELPRAGRERFARSLGELRAFADELPALELWACAAAVELLDADPADVDRRLAGTLSMPRFLAETGGARLVFA
jgi:peroxiredoxin family protein